MLKRRLTSAICLTVLLAGPLAAASAQWNPSSGEWGKDDPRDVRVMTYNVQDGICRNAIKTETLNSWAALAHIVAAMKPDVLILQEAGDNSGNGTGGGIDSPSQLETTLELFIHGGSDPFVGGTVGAYAQKYDPAFDLPYIFASTADDNYNRNVILSRFPFMDLNGDTVAERSDVGFILPDEYAPGGNGGIRGFMFAELDLPDSDYAGDLVIGNAHLKSGGSGGDYEDRLTASQNVAYYIDYLLNGAGTGMPDPHGKIVDSPAATTILDDDTPVVIGGDWNEDESKNGRRGPALWLTGAQYTGTPDGTDRDRGDMTYDGAAEPYSGDTSTQSSSKLDYLAWQDSIATLRRAFIFNSGSLSGVPSWYPPEIASFQLPYLATGLASDHRPVIADFMLPAADPLILGDMNCDGVLDFSDINPFVMALTDPDGYAAMYPGCDPLRGDYNGNDELDFGDINGFVIDVTG